MSTKICILVEKKHSRPLPATPPLSIKENLGNYPWFQDISREEAETAVSAGKLYLPYLFKYSPPSNSVRPRIVSALKSLLQILVSALE